MPPLLPLLLLVNKKKCQMSKRLILKPLPQPQLLLHRQLHQHQLLPQSIMTMTHVAATAAVERTRLTSNLTSKSM